MKQRGCYIYFNEEWLKPLQDKAEKKGMTLGEFCKKVIERESLRSHRKKEG
jgi:hypothetical protein